MNNNNKLTRFDEGKSHEENPNGGVMIGNNNSVEENETRQGDFIYSNRIFLDENIVSQYNLPKSLIGKSVADATKLIDNKFKGRNDKISQSTKDSLLSKIAEAQESMKPQESEIEESGIDPNQMAFGGLEEESSIIPGLGLINSAMDLGNTAFGKSTQDTSGLSSSAPINTVDMVGGTALKGATAGMAFGPIGAGAGALIGGVAGLLGAGKAKKAASRNSSNYAKNINDQFSDQYADGGKIDPSKKDVRKQGDVIRVPEDRAIDRVEEFIPTTNKVIDTQKRDVLATQAAIGFKDWYTNPATAEKFAKNTGFDKNRIKDFVQRGLDTPTRPFKPGEEYDNNGSQMAAQYLTPSTMNKLPKGQILYDATGDPRSKDKSGVVAAIGHEFPHASTLDTVLGKPLMKVLGDPNKQTSKNTSAVNKKYLSRPEESYGNFHQFRLELGLKPGEKIDAAKLKQLVNDKKVGDNMFYQTYDDDKIVKAVNTIASNNSTNNVNYAAYGGKMKQMADGGDYYENLKLNARNQDPNALGLQNFLKPIGTTVPYTIGTQPAVDISNANRIATSGPSTLDVLKYNANKIGNVVNNNIGNMVRYAPIAANAYQLSQLKKPSGVRLNRLDNRFKPNYVDTAQQQNIINQELNNTNSAIQQSGVSQGAARNAILGAQLNKTKALSNAYMNAEAQNRQQDNIAQQFNLGVDQTNLQQSNAELDINDRNSAAYRNEKSKYLSAIGSDIGEVGKEEIYKKIAKTTTGYSWLGEYQKANPSATSEQIEEAARKAGVLTTSTTKKALGGYLLKNKGK